MTERRELLEFHLDPAEVAELASGRSGGARRVDRSLPKALPVLLAAATAAIVSTGVIAILAWPGLPGPTGVVPVLVLACVAGTVVGRLLQRNAR